jgi:hypothetical protein
MVQHALLLHVTQPSLSMDVLPMVQPDVKLHQLQMPNNV